MPLNRTLTEVNSDLWKLVDLYDTNRISRTIYDVARRHIRSGLYTYGEFCSCHMEPNRTREVYRFRTDPTPKESTSMSTNCYCTTHGCHYRKCGCKPQTVDGKLQTLTHTREMVEREISYFSSLPDEPERWEDGTPTIIVLEYTECDKDFRYLLISRGSPQFPWVVLDSNLSVVSDGTWEQVITQTTYKAKAEVRWWLVTDFDIIFEHPPVDQDEKENAE